MRPIVTDGVAWSVCLSVCHDREPSKMAEPTEMRFGMWTRVGPRKHVLDMGPDPHARMGNFEGENGQAQNMPRRRYICSGPAGAATVRCRC